MQEQLLRTLDLEVNGLFINLIENDMFLHIFYNNYLEGFFGNFYQYNKSSETYERVGIIKLIKVNENESTSADQLID